MVRLRLRTSTDRSDGLEGRENRLSELLHHGEVVQPLNKRRLARHERLQIGPATRADSDDSEEGTRWCVSTLNQRPDLNGQPEQCGRLWNVLLEYEPKPLPSFEVR